jgi:hypothetical protein
MTGKASKKHAVKIRQKNEDIKRALLTEDQAGVARAREELLAAITESMSRVEREIDNLMKDVANDR